MNWVSFKSLSSLSATSLEIPFSKEEIKVTVFGLGGDWAPGPDGFPIVFFQHFWNLLEDELQIFFNEFHENGVVPKELGASFIALIPKKEGAILLKDFRPISLIGRL